MSKRPECCLGQEPIEHPPISLRNLRDIVHTKRIGLPDGVRGIEALNGLDPDALRVLNRAVTSLHRRRAS